MSSDNESEISTLTPSQDNDTKKEDDSADEPEEEQAENLPNDNADHLVDARSSPSPTLPENEFDYEEEDAINLDNNDVNYEEEDQQFHKIETHMPEAEELQGEDISEGESDEEDEKVDEGKNCKEESKIKQEEESAEEGELDNLEEGEIIDSDDGIPEIKESMSPPTDDFSKSFETHNNYTNDNNIGGYQQQPYEHKERETCRFFLRGNCKNGSICRFKHSFTTNDRAQYHQSASNTIRPPSYIPPPTGPPVPLLTTEFAPPPSLAPLIRPSAPVNTDSVAWEQGLKKAREIVRRQKTETTPTKAADEKEEEEAADDKSDDSFGKKFEENDEKSPPRFAAAETVKPNVEEAPRQFQQHRQYFPSSSNTQNHHHRPIASRMVVEYVSKVTSPSIGGGSYGQRKGNEKYKSKTTIPSLIDNIIDKPMSPPPRGRTSMKGKQQRDQDGRRTFKTNNYADPWSRQNNSGGGDHDGGAKRDGRRNQQLSRKRRHSSSATSSSSDEGIANRRVRRSSPSTNLHRKSNNRHSNESLAKERTSMEREREDARKVAKREESSSTSKVNLRRNDSASSHTSSSKKGEKKPMTHGRQPSSRSSSVSSTTSTSSDSSSREAVTLGSLLKTNPLDMAQQSAKSKGPKTPPTPAEQSRPGSESTSASSRPPSAENKKKRGLPSNHTDKSENTRSRQNSIKLDQQRRFSRGSNQSIENDGKRRHSQLLHSSFLKNEENEEEDAPAAYRISRKSNEDVKQKRRNDRASSSSSSLSSSSSSSSSLTSSSSTIGGGQRKNKSAGGEKAMVTICSSERIPIAEPSLDDKVAPISSDDEADMGKANGQKLRELTKQRGTDGIEGEVTLNQKAKDKVEADKVNTKEGHKPVADVENSSSTSNVQNSKEESRKRKLEILQKLQSVEKAIARKKQKIDGGAEE